MYVEASTTQKLSPEQQKAYDMTVETFEAALEQMKSDYQAALDSQGIVSGAVNAFCSRWNIGT
ncbi:MAG: hypothetical protein ACI4FV_03235, partial [Lachnospiraceae bacterium]